MKQKNKILSINKKTKKNDRCISRIIDVLVLIVEYGMSLLCFTNTLYNHRRCIYDMYIIL